MPIPKFQHFYQLMWQKNENVLTEFKKIHDVFLSDKSMKEEFDSKGRRVLDIIRDWERRLCHGMERGQYAKYSEKLSEKYWGLVRKDFELIDEVGVIKKP